MAKSRAYEIAFKLNAMMGSKFGKTFSEAENRAEQLANKMNAVGSRMTLGVTAPLLAVGTAALKVGADYESSLGNIQARTNMAAEEVDNLSRSFRAMAVSGDYGGFTAREVASAYGEVAVAGQTAEQGTELMRSAMVLATATGNDLSNTAYFLGNYLIKIGGDASNSEKYVNLFAQGIANTGIGLSDMQKYMFQMTPAFEQMGSSAETNVGILTRLYQVGVRGADLYSGMGSIMSDFALGGDFASAATERFGVSMHDANGQLRSSEDIMFDVAIAMRDYGDQAETGRFKLDNLNDSQRDAWFEFMRNAELIQNDVIPSFYEATDAIDGAGVAFEMAATQQSGLAGSAAQVRASLEEISLQISDVLMPHAARLIGRVGDVVSWFANLDESTQRNVVRFAMFAAAIGPVLMVTGKLIKTVNSVRAAYATFQATLQAVKGTTALLAKAEKAKTAATIAGNKATELANIASAARKVAKSAETKALKLAAEAEAIKMTAGANSTKATAAAMKAEQARTAATSAAAIASQKAAAADKQRSAATKINTAAVKLNTAAQKSNKLSTTLLGKAMTLLSKVTVAAGAKKMALGVKVAGLSAKMGLLSATMAKGTVIQKLLALGTKGLSVAFAVMSKAIMAIPVFGWILAAITGVVAGVVLLISWLNRVGAEYQEIADAAKATREAQEEFSNSMAEQAAQFEENSRSMENNHEHLRGLAESIEYLTSKQELSAGEMARLENYMAQMNGSVPGLALAFDEQTGALNLTTEALSAYLSVAERQSHLDAQMQERTRIQQNAITIERRLNDVSQERLELEAKLNDGTRRNAGDVQRLRDAIADKTAAEEGYGATLEENARRYEELNGLIEENASALESMRQAQHDAMVAMYGYDEAMRRQAFTAEEWEEAHTEALDKMTSSFERYQTIAGNAFRQVSEDAAISVADLIGNLNHNAEALEQWSINMAVLAERGLDEGLLEQLRQAGPEAAATVAGIVAACDYEFAALNEAAENSTRVAVESMQREFDPAGVTESAEELIDHVALTILENQAMEYAMIDKVNASFDAMANAISHAGFDDAAYEIPRGAANAIDDGTGMVVAAGERMINRTLAGMEAAAQISSPSKKTYEMFQFVMDGGIGGLYSKEGELISAGENIMHSLADSIYSTSGAVENACGSVSNTIADNLNAAISVPDVSMPKLNSMKWSPLKFDNLPKGFANAQATITSVQRFENLFDDDDSPPTPGQRLTQPKDYIRQINSSGYQGDNINFTYAPSNVYNIEGVGNADELRTMLAGLTQTEYSDFERKVLDVLKRDKIREERFSNV